MIKLFFFILNTLFLSSIVCGQTNREIVVSNPLPFEKESLIKDSVYSELIKHCKYFEITIKNPLTDTVYLFDSYLLDDLIYSKYLHRIDKPNRVHKISFIPIIPYLSVEKSDVIVLGKERIVKRNQVLYGFKTIPPKTYLRIKINYKIFNNDENIVDFDAKKMSKFDNVIFENERTIDTIRYSKCVEFAIYKNVSLLTSKKSYYLDEFNFNWQAQSFIIISCIINE